MHFKNLKLIIAFSAFAVKVLSGPILQSEDVSTNVNEASNIVVSKAVHINSNSYYDNEDTDAEESDQSVDFTPDDIQDSEEIAKKDIENFNWSLTADDINNITNELLNNQELVINQILEIPDDECSFENVIFPLLRKLEDEIDRKQNIITFLQNVAVDGSVRDASTDASYTLEGASYLGNPAILQKISKVIANIDSGKVASPTHPEDIKVLEIFRKSISANNNIDSATLERINGLQMEIMEKAYTLMDCLYDPQEQTATVVFTKSELDGVPTSVIRLLKPTTKNGEEAYIATPKSTIYSGILTTAKNENTRKAIMALYHQRCKPNVQLLKEIVNMKTEVAKTLGYKSHSEYVLESKMAKTTKNVFEFLDSLKEKLLPQTRAENENLLELKKEEKEELNESFDNTLHLYDVDYYRKMYNQKKYSLDNAKVSEYFPVVDVINEMLKMYEEIFSLKINEVQNPNTWHPDVRQFLVFDQKTDNYMGSFYIDLFYREGKVTYSAAFHLGYGYEKENGTRSYPAAALVTSFSKPSYNEPALLTHYDITVVFHELGHIFHEIISETKYTRFNGYNVEQDFLEVPSQMLEYFCWEPEVIERLSKHYADGSKMPSDLINTIITTKKVNYGNYYNINLLFKSYVDMRLYSIENVDPALDPVKVWDETRKEITLVDSIENTWPVAVFDHIVDGYDAGYYGYLWSQVYAADIYFSQFKKNGIFNPETGDRYRNIILKRGSTMNAMDILKEFLGREPSDDAFIKK
ncbi:zincin [Piromyces finnis]|uniref:Zincin n=1 Tax=Piromyces finnis TaxID=1754191 RepID=A0A1Y1V7B2_9FUNG|nr:zincin [Piromyces finnis]|eukprot:ORX48464.1 zincin [Piromyces finnis]